MKSAVCKLVMVASSRTLLHTSREVEDNGNVIGTRAMFVDITGRKQTEEALRKSEERFRLVISSISDHIYVIRVMENGDRVMLYMSPHVEAMTGYPIENFLNDWRFWPSTVIHPEDRAAAAAQAEQNALGKQSEVEYRLVRADGSIIWVRDSATVQSEEGTTSRIVYGLVSDITERKQAELEREWLTKELQNINQTLDERVRARTAELQAIFDAAGEGIVVTTLSGIIEYVNPAMERLTGYSAAEVIGQTARVWKSGQQHSTFYSQMWQTILAGQTWRGELVNKRKNGSLYDALLTITPIPGSNGQPVGFVGMQSDITPFKEMDRLKSEFVSMAAHELRTPLTSILGFSEILLTRQLTEDRKGRYLAFINQQANALRAILDDLLDLSRLESGQGFEIIDTAVDLKEIITEIVFGFQENNPKHYYNIISPDGWPPIKGDAPKLAQLFKNLYSNATKYSPDGGEITLQVAVQQEHGLLHLSLSDQGIGMTQEQVAQVFERFYRADASNTAIGGTGLGMTISRLIVERHRGKIWIESEYSKGTTVHLFFPLIDRPTYILIIEDDQSLRELQQRVLRSEGYTVLGAEDGFSGLKFAKTGLPDVILLDLALPGLAGFDVLEQLQANYLTKDIPVVITSAIDTAAEIERAIQKGAVDYLVKPYSMGDLNIRVNRALVKSPIRTVTTSQIANKTNKWPS
ncbi:MAG: PAS domain S-box protein [Anaerolineae bacterium]